MTANVESEIAEITEIAVRLLDDAHLAWFTAQGECERALHQWLQGGPDDGETRYGAYQAALDREASAAHDLERLTELAEPCRERLAARVVRRQREMTLTRVNSRRTIWIVKD